MRVVFLGTGEFAVPTLEALAGAGHVVAGVVTQPDRPAGRHRRVAPGPVHRAAAALGLNCLQPRRIGADSAVEALCRLAPDVLLVVAYGQILPPAVLGVPRLGCYNAHPSLLPALRGPAPINWAILTGLDRTGVTVIRMAPAVDTGEVVARRAADIGPRETAGELAERLSRLAAELVLEALPLIESGRLKPVPQDDRLASRAPKLTKADGAIDWARPAVALDRHVRGMNPWPGAFAVLERVVAHPPPRVRGATAGAPQAGGVRLMVHRARPAEGAGPPGTVIGLSGEGLLVAAGEGALALETIQPAGKRPMAAADFVNGYRVQAGDRFLAVGEVEL